MPDLIDSVDVHVLEQLLSIGATDEELADYFGVPSELLEEHYSAIMRKGRASMRMSLRRDLFQMSRQGKPTAAKFLGLQHLGMENNPKHFPNDQNGNAAALLEALLQGQKLVEREDEAKKRNSGSGLAG